MALNNLVFSRLYSWRDDESNEIPIDSSRMDAEWQELIEALNFLLKPVAFVVLPVAAALTWNLTTRPNAIVTLTRNVDSLTLTGGFDGGTYTLAIRQDATGGRSFPFPSAWKWQAGVADDISTAANSVTILTIRRIGNDIYAAPLLENLQ